MSESAAVDAYKRMLEGVAERADRIGPRVIASHWPFVGTDYRRLLIVGQALAGWDDKTSPALWTPADVAMLAGRDSVLAATKEGRLLDPSRSRSRCARVPTRPSGPSRSGQWKRWSPMGGALVQPRSLVEPVPAWVGRQEPEP